MASSPERTPRERETLIFSQPHEAREFAERVGARVARQTHPEIRRPRELVAEAVGREIERQGEAVGSLTRPWEHTSEEHREAKQLVDLAFSQDLEAALKQARASKAYPRNIDLLHDVLTGELYALIAERHLNRQKVPRWPLYAALVLAAVAAGVLVLLLTLPR